MTTHKIGQHTPVLQQRANATWTTNQRRLNIRRSNLTHRMTTHKIGQHTPVLQQRANATWTTKDPVKRVVGGQLDQRRQAATAVV